MQNTPPEQSVQELTARVRRLESAVLALMRENDALKVLVLPECVR